MNTANDNYVYTVNRDAFKEFLNHTIYINEFPKPTKCLLQCQEAFKILEEGGSLILTKGNDIISYMEKVNNIYQETFYKT